MPILTITTIFNLNNNDYAYSEADYDINNSNIIYVL